MADHPNDPSNGEGTTRKPDVWLDYEEEQRLALAVEAKIRDHEEKKRLRSENNGGSTSVVGVEETTVSTPTTGVDIDSDDDIIIDGTIDDGTIDDGTIDDGTIDQLNELLRMKFTGHEFIGTPFNDRTFESTLDPTGMLDLRAMFIVTDDGNRILDPAYLDGSRVMKHLYVNDNWEFRKAYIHLEDKLVLWVNFSGACNIYGDTHQLKPEYKALFATDPAEMTEFERLYGSLSELIENKRQLYFDAKNPYSKAKRMIFAKFDEFKEAHLGILLKDE
jgi:hypothetical protein